jgi:hypothetical protein
MGRRSLAGFGAEGVSVRSGEIDDVAYGKNADTGWWVAWALPGDASHHGVPHLIRPAQAGMTDQRCGFVISACRVLLHSAESEIGQSSSVAGESGSADGTQPMIIDVPIDLRLRGLEKDRQGWRQTVG